MNYLRVRGEYSSKPLQHTTTAELPPRARRILETLKIGIVPRGTTSACAENTSRKHQRRGNLRNYLRVRGEYRPRSEMTALIPELPPRARRIPFTTSSSTACGGEYRQSSRRRPSCVELPPRARRIRNLSARAYPSPGTTSACAENTDVGGVLIVRNWNYLRVRGEYVNGWCANGHYRELPPRARRILTLCTIRTLPYGTTSACAENTVVRSCGGVARRNYLRVRGEY